jgi:hypothetical protein
LDEVELMLLVEDPFLSEDVLAKRVRPDRRPEGDAAERRTGTVTDVRPRGVMKYSPSSTTTSPR